MDPDDAEDLTLLLTYDEETAGGVMTTSIVTFDASLTVGEARARLADHDSYDDIARVESVLVLDDDGVVVDDILMIDLFMAAPDDTLGSLTGAPWPVTVPADAPLDDVIEAFVENRGSSIVVVDESDHPLGRILADDVIDALLPHRERSRRHFSGILS
jgi:Mg/Co/Ni transporter MgtE